MKKKESKYVAAVGFLVAGYLVGYSFYCPPAITGLALGASVLMFGLGIIIAVD